MEKIGTQLMWSYYGPQAEIRTAKNATVRAAPGYPVKTYFQLAMKIAELQYKNREYVLLFRGQKTDHKTSKGNSMLKPSLLRLHDNKPPTLTVLKEKLAQLEKAEAALINQYGATGLADFSRLKRQRIVRWSILQHYEVCDTPLLDVTASLRIAASMASYKNETDDAYLYVLGVPNISGAITASYEAGLQIVRLSSACPPSAVRPHIQEGYLLGEYPEFSDFRQKGNYSYYEMDFGRRLIAKFRFDPKELWSSENYPPASNAALFPQGHRDALLEITQNIKRGL